MRADGCQGRFVLTCLVETPVNLHTFHSLAAAVLLPGGDEGPQRDPYSPLITRLICDPHRPGRQRWTWERSRLNALHLPCWCTPF